MKAVVQRVKRAQVRVKGKLVGRIGQGLLVLVGVGKEDNQAKVDWLADKLVNLRVFADQKDKMNRSLKSVNGQVLVVSQFTLYADCTKGRRPSFVKAAGPKKAERLYDYLIDRLEAKGVKVASGVFGAMMAVELVNDGPVTVIFEQ